MKIQYLQEKWIRTILFSAGGTLRGINCVAGVMKAIAQRRSSPRGKSAIYGAHNLIIKNENITSGIFIDFLENYFDISSKNYCLMEITVFGKDFDISHFRKQ